MSNLKLTNQDKIVIYKQAINILNEEMLIGIGIGMCDAIRIVYRRTYIGYNSIDSDTIIRQHFIELLDYKPENCVWPYWFPLNEIGRKKRIEILEDIIVKLTNK